MQKTTRKASILIWTIFLSIIISMAFLGISTKIHKNIKNSGEFITQLDNRNEIDSFIKQVSESKTFNNTNFGNNISIEFESDTSIIRGLKAGEHSEYRFDNSSNTTLEITLLSGGPIVYSDTNESDIISTSAAYSTISDTIFLKNLGGNSRFEISSGKTILAPEKKYTLYRKIGNLKSIQSKGTIYNFTPGAFQ